MEYIHITILTLTIFLKILLIANLKNNLIFINKLIDEKIKVKNFEVKIYENKSFVIDAVVIFVSILASIFLYTSATLFFISLLFLLITEYQYVLVKTNRIKERLLIL